MSDAALILYDKEEPKMSPRTPDEVATINELVKGFETVIDLVAQERRVDRQLVCDALEYLMWCKLVEVCENWQMAEAYFDGPMRDRLKGTWDRTAS
jgi:hypothetical protein